MSMRKIILLSQVSTLTLLVYMAILKEMDFFIGITIFLSIVSIILNLIVEVQNGRRK